MEIKSQLKNIWEGVVKNGCNHCHRTLKLAVSLEGINGINWHFYMLTQIQGS